MLIQIHSTGPYTISMYRLGQVYTIKVEKNEETLYKKNYRDLSYAEIEWKLEIDRCRAAHENL